MAKATTAQVKKTIQTLRQKGLSDADITAKLQTVGVPQEKIAELLGTANPASEQTVQTEARPMDEPAPTIPPGRKQYHRRGEGGFAHTIGDLADALKTFCLSPNTIYALAIALAVFFFLWNLGPYAALFKAHIAPIKADLRWLDMIPMVGFLIRLGIEWVLSSVATIVAFLLLAVVQFVQVLPRIGNYLPGALERRLFKLAKVRYRKPSEAEGTPTLAAKLYGWAITTAERNQDLVFWLSCAFYCLDVYICALETPVGDFKTGFNLLNLFLVALRVGGFEKSLLFASIINDHRLSSREEAEFLAQHPHLNTK